MNKQLVLGSLVLVILLLNGSQALALSCDSISMENKQVCLNILNSNISLAEKEALISNLEYSSTYYPDHNYIFLRNTNIKFQNPPENVQTSQGIFIKDAWIDIFGVMPSIIYNNSLFCPSRTKVLTGYNYRIVLPSDYSSPGYPSTNGGDCRRNYFLLGNNSENRIIVNGLYQGSGSLVNVQIPYSTNINANYQINADVKEDHYSWSPYCCKKKNRKCVKYCYSCDFSSSRVNNDNLLLQDSIPVKLYNNSLIGIMDVKDIYESTTKFQTNFSNAIEISFNTSYYDFYDFVYSINYSKSPYYFATLKAEDYKQEKISNILKEGNGFVVKNVQNCKIRAFDFFNVLNTNCNIDYEETLFSLKVNSFYYAIGENISVYLFPSADYNVSYGNETKIGYNVNFKARLGENKIRVEYNGKTQEHFIFVYDQNKIALIIKIILFFLFIYIFYKLMRKIVKRFL